MATTQQQPPSVPVDEKDVQAIHLLVLQLTNVDQVPVPSPSPHTIHIIHAYGYSDSDQGCVLRGGTIRLMYLVAFLKCVCVQRENALLELSKKRETFPDLAPILWHSYGTIAALLQEIISIYSMLSPPTLSPHASNRVCNALALLQCVASHPETKSKLMNGTA
jgi:Cell differentiation family, Rcd1-like